MKKIYFIRHGITGGNEINAYQQLDTPLSEKGRAQANFLAERFTKIPFDVLIASTMERAQETARAIAQKTGHEVIAEGLFHEILRPSVVRGKVQTDPEVKEVIKVADSYWKVEGKRHSDEENFYDLKKRAVKALEYLISRDEETMVVVTHGTILKMMLAVMVRGDTLEPDFWDEIEKFFFPQNTGITWVEYNNEYNPNHWQLITWNDHAHLG
jgi:broad specificity phosphatase PhoE